MDLASLHPLLVHAPLVLLPCAVLFRLLHTLLPKSGLRVAAILLLIGGVGLGLLAKESGEAAEHQAERASSAVEDITVAGAVPEFVAGGSLLETHAQLAEATVVVFSVLLLVEIGLFFLSAPFFARWRGNLGLSLGIQRIAGGLWLAVAIASLALVVLTGHYGGKLVYEHGVGVTPSTGTTSQK
jgi:uncharacterized membrane protein